MEEFHKIKGDKFENSKLQEIHDVVWDFWCNKFANKVFVYSYRKDEEVDYSKYFKIVETFEAGDHDYSKITPMYFLKIK